MGMVLDISVLVAAIRSPGGASKQLLLRALERRYVLAASVPMILEYEAVLTRAQHLAAVGLSIREVDEFLDSVVAISEPVRLAFSWRPMLRDPNDDMILETALDNGASAIATFNRRDFAEVGGRFGIAVLSPGEALKRVRLLRAK
jgi:putative PIN family toxin of toxin-antitoxin system